MLAQLKTALDATGVPFALYGWSEAPAGEYGVVSLDGGDALHADDQHAEQASTVKVELFTRDTTGTSRTDVEAVLDCLPGCAWEADSVRLDDDSGLIHYTWIASEFFSVGEEPLSPEEYGYRKTGYRYMEVYLGPGEELYVGPNDEVYVDLITVTIPKPPVPQKLSDSLMATGLPFALFGWSEAPDGDYGVFAPDGANDLCADDAHAEHSVEGTVDFFTRDDSDAVRQTVEAALSSVEGCAWYLNSVQMEQDTGYIHLEWVFEVV